MGALERQFRSCPADLDKDGAVGIVDFLILLSQWFQPNSPADVNGDGTVGVADMNLMLAAWGPCE